MAGYDRDEVPMLSDTHPALLDEILDSQFQASTSHTRSVSISIPMSSLESYEDRNKLVGYTGPWCSARKTPLVQMSGPLNVDSKPGSFFQRSNSTIGSKQVESKAERSGHGINKADWEGNVNAAKNEHLMRSQQLGMCDDTYSRSCPSYHNAKAMQHRHSRASSIFDPTFLNAFYGDAKGWARRFRRAIESYILGRMNPQDKGVQNWNRFFLICCLVAIFLDPLFFFLLTVKQDYKCIAINWRFTKIIVVLRSLTDFVYLLNIVLQFSLAYVAPESTVVGAGELVDHPTRIAQNYFKGSLYVDLFVWLPLPQIIVLVVLPINLGSSGANYAKDLLRVAVLIQYIPRLFRFLPLLVGQSPSGLIFETAWANFFINLFTFMLSAHVIGSCWYLFGLQRVNQCLRDACDHTDFRHECLRFIDCGDGNASNEFGSDLLWKSWTKNGNATSCFTGDSFAYGIYKPAVNLTSKNLIKRYVFSLFWGLQQISTLAGNQQPSYFYGEILFTMLIIGLGLLLFAFLIGNMQNFLQALGRRRLEFTLRQRDVQQWMNHRRLPQKLRRRVLDAERYNWSATRGVNEGMLIENLPEDLQRDIRRHVFKFVETVGSFDSMDRHILDAICERLKPTIYMKGSEILYPGGVVDKMVFIVHGKLQSIGEDGNVTPLCEGSVCGEEFLTWFVQHISVRKDGRIIKVTGQRLLSKRTVRCVSNVEAFSLRAADLEEVSHLYLRSLRNPRVQRDQSPYYRRIAPTGIQVAWRCRRRRLRRGSSSETSHLSKN